MDQRGKNVAVPNQQWSWWVILVKCIEKEKMSFGRGTTLTVSSRSVRPRGGSQCLVPRAHLLRETLGGGLPPSGTSASLHGARGGRSVQKPLPDSPTEEGTHLLVQRLLPPKRGSPQGGWCLPQLSYKTVTYIFNICWMWTHKSKTHSLGWALQLWSPFPLQCNRFQQKPGLDFFQEVCWSGLKSLSRCQTLCSSYCF